MAPVRESRALPATTTLTPLHPTKATGRRARGPGFPGTASARRLRTKTIASENPESILPYSYAGTMELLQGSSMIAASSTGLASLLTDHLFLSRHVRHAVTCLSISRHES